MEDSHFMQVTLRHRTGREETIENVDSLWETDNTQELRIEHYTNLPFPEKTTSTYDALDWRVVDIETPNAPEPHGHSRDKQSQCTICLQTGMQVFFKTGHLEQSGEVVEIPPFTRKNVDGTVRAVDNKILVKSNASERVFEVSPSEVEPIVKGSHEPTPSKNFVDVRYEREGISITVYDKDRNVVEETWNTWSEIEEKKEINESHISLEI